MESTFPLPGLALCPVLNTKYHQSDRVPVPDLAFKSGSVCFLPLGKVSFLKVSSHAVRKSRLSAGEKGHMERPWNMRHHMKRELTGGEPKIQTWEKGFHGFSSPVHVPAEYSCLKGPSETSRIAQANHKIRRNYKLSLF